MLKENCKGMKEKSISLGMNSQVLKVYLSRHPEKISKSF